jgi:hypothetical protein
VPKKTPKSLESKMDVNNFKKGGGRKLVEKGKKA